MASNSRNLNFNLVGTDVSASSTFAKTGQAGEDMSTKIGGAISKLGGIIGGELGDVVDKVGEGFDKFGDAASGVGTKLAAAGAGVAALGLALQTLGSADKAAEQQLDAAVEATGDSVSNYTGALNKAISAGENFGHSASDTMNALTRLTQVTGDLNVSLQYMGLVDDLAAAKHEDLATAANSVAIALGGSSKLFKQFGIDVGTGTLSVQEINQGLAELSAKLSGQASAASDTFTGKVDSLKTHIEDLAAKFGNYAGPAITYFGTGLAIVGSGMDILAAKSAKAAAQAAELTAAEAKQTEILAEASAASEAAALEQDTLGAVSEKTAARVVSADAAVEAANAAAAESAEASSFAFGPVGLAIGAVSIAAGLAAGAMELFGGSEKSAATPIQGLTDVLVQQNGAFNGVTQSSIVASEASKHLFDQTDKLGLQQASLTAGLNGNTGAYEANVTQLNNLITAGTKQIAVYSAHGAIAGYTTSLDSSAQAAQKALSTYQSLHASILVNLQDAKDQIAANQQISDTFDAVDYSVDQTSAEFKAGADASSQYTNAVKELNSASLDAADDQYAFLDSLSQVATSVTQNGKSLDANTDKGRANAEAVLASIKNINTLTQASIANGDTTAQTTVKLNANNAALVTAATKAGLNKTQIQQMIAQYELTPTKISTQIDVDDTAALVAITDVTGKLNYINGLASTDLGEFLKMVPLADELLGSSAAANRANSASGGIIGMAGGGIKQLFGTNVDEFGSELLDMGTGRVYPHGQSDQMKRGTQGGVTNHYTFNISTPTVVQPTPDTMRAITAHLEAWARQGGQIKIARAIN